MDPNQQNSGQSDDTNSSTGSGAGDMQDGVDKADETMASQGVDPAEVKPEDKAEIGQDMSDNKG